MRKLSIELENAPAARKKYIIAKLRDEQAALFKWQDSVG
jgi:hypothetical protein